MPPYRFVYDGIVRGAVFLACLLACAVARADDVDDHVARGEELARRGELTQAIAAFKKADAIRPKARNACLIGLAYTRRELWAEAELFFALCRQRATADDPLPDWIDEAERQLTAKLSAVEAASIAFAIEPANATATITVSSFAPGESFAPRTIHLAPGTHVITISAEGFRSERREVTVEHGGAQTLAVHLTPVAPPPPPRGGHAPAGHRSRLPLYIAGAGGALAIAGVAYDLLALQPVRNDLLAGTNARYEASIDSFRTRQHVTIGLFAGAGIVTAAAVVLHVMLKPAESGVGVGVSVHDGGGAVSLEWSR